MSFPLDVRWGIGALTAGIAALDSFTERGSAEGTLYTLPVLLTFVSRSDRLALLTSLAASLLNLAGYVASPQAAGVPLRIALVNRIYALVVIWVTYGAVRLAWRADAAQRESDRNLRLLIDGMTGYAIYQIDLAGAIKTWNPGAERLLGYAPEEILGANYGRFFPPDARGADDPWRSLARAMADGSVEVEGWRVRKDGSRLWASGAVTGLRNARGDPEGFAVVTRDLSERRASEALFRSVFDHAGDCIIGSDDRGTIELFNPAAEAAFGYAASEIVGQNLRVLMPEPDRSQHDTYMATYLRTRQAKVIGRGREVMARRKDGSTFPVRLALTEFLVDGRWHFVGLLHDLAPIKRLEAEERTRQKMEAVGQLAGGVAHDFNNLLTVISGNTELALRQVPQGDPIHGKLAGIDRAATRAADLTRQLLAFGRKQALSPKVIDLNAVVADMEKMLTRLIREDITLKTVLSENLWRIRADIGQLEQIITNLAINARDAMPHGGRLTIETRNIVLGDEDAGSEKGLQPGPHVVLAVSDTGNGMDPETLGRVFEPFFTTKGLGRGTGLGLATVYGIVKQSGGGIWVYSEPGKGSVFKIALPHTDAPLDALDAPTPGLVPGTETILLVEDEQDVRGLARQALEEAGYTVLDAADGLLALDIAARHTGEIHLLVTDVVMPRMHGRAVAERLTALRPGLKVLYMSGYTANVIVHHGILDTGIEFLEKPFTPSALTIKVRATLDL